MTFRVGQKVECIRGCSQILFPWDDEIDAHVGEVYTIRAIRVFSDGIVGFHVVEITNGPRLYSEGFDELYFCSRRFRPIVERKTDIGFAHEILRKVTRKDRVPA